MKGWLIAFLIAWALPALAQDYPAAHSVTGVAVDDVLNIRAAPSASAPILGSFAPDRRAVEVLGLSADGRWGRIGMGEGNGWVSMRYLVRDPVPAGAIPRPMRCIGTEPFWALTLTPDGAEYSTPEGRIPLTPRSEAAAPEGYLATLSGPQGGEWTAIIDRAQCSDGMSDRDYGFGARVFLRFHGADRLLSGCCTLDGG